MSVSRWLKNGWVVAVLAVGILLGTQLQHAPPLVKPAVADGVPTGDASLLRKTSESFRAVAKRVIPVVVNIKSTEGAPEGRGQVRRRGRSPRPGGSGGPSGDPFSDFFRGFGGSPFEPPQGQGGGQSPGATSLGSGIVIDKRGYILTNNHVVAHGSRLRVILSDDESREVPAKLVGADPKTDLAVIKIDAPHELPVAEWAESDSIEVGDWAIAIGSPFMLSHSVTAGIVSAKGRNASELMGSGYGYGMIQTDAAINPGNSGGPLCAIDGKIMGVNTAIYSRSGGYMGIGFAIPSNLAREVASTLIEKGKVVRGWLGITIQKIDPELAADVGTKEGVLVHQAQPGGPAASAGMGPGDIIVEMNGKPVKDPGDLQLRVSAEKPGASVSFKIISYENKKARNVTVKVGEAPAQPQEREPRGEMEEEPRE